MEIENRVAHGETEKRGEYGTVNRRSIGDRMWNSKQGNASWETREKEIIRYGEQGDMGERKGNNMGQ